MKIILQKLSLVYKLCKGDMNHHKQQKLSWSWIFMCKIQTNPYKTSHFEYGTYKTDQSTANR